MPERTAKVARRRIRRVPDADRKRGRQACIRCKTRKNRCIQTPSGICQRCLVGSHRCRFDGETPPDLMNESQYHDATFQAPDEPSSTPQFVNGDQATDAPSGSGKPNGSRQSFMWRLRESFFLDPVAAIDDGGLARQEASINQAFTSDQQHRARLAARSFPPHDIARFLVQKCVHHGTDSFFYFDQEATVRNIDRLYENNSPLRSDISFVCFALALFALGSQWTTLYTKPSSMAPTTRGTSDLAPDPGHRFYIQARSLLPDLLDRPDLTSVQATFLLGVYTIPVSISGAGYLYIGLALRQAVSLGYHLQEAQPARLYDQEVQRRLFWSVYSLDKTHSLKLGRPRSIAIESITVALPNAESPVLRNQPFDNVHHQIANAKLARILDRVANFGTWSPEKTHVYTRLDHDLRSWKRELPAELQFENVATDSPGYRTVFHLHLNHSYAYIALGKLTILSRVRARLNDQPQTETAPSPSETTVAQAAVKAAQKVLRLFEQVQRHGQLARFSYTDFQGCSVATVIILLAGILVRDFEYASRVSFGLGCLKVLAGPHVNVNIGVQFVESLKLVADECHERLHREPRPYDNSFTNDDGGGLQRWSDWLASVAPRKSVPAMPMTDFDASIALASLGSATTDRGNAHAMPAAAPDLVVAEQGVTTDLQQSDLLNPAPASNNIPAANLQPDIWSTEDHDYDMTFTMMNCDEDWLVNLTGMDGLNDFF